MAVRPRGSRLTSFRAYAARGVDGRTRAAEVTISGEPFRTAEMSGPMAAKLAACPEANASWAVATSALVPCGSKVLGPVSLPQAARASESAAAANDRLA